MISHVRLTTSKELMLASCTGPPARVTTHSIYVVKLIVGPFIELNFISECFRSYITLSELKTRVTRKPVIRKNMLELP